MARCPLVKPEVVRVPLGDDWLELKRELNAGEYRAMIVAQFNREALAGERISMNLEQVGLSKIVAYLVGWSFVDFNDQPLPVTAETLLKLDQATFQDVLSVVDAHHEKWEQAVEARKNDQAGKMRPAVISSSAA